MKLAIVVVLVGCAQADSKPEVAPQKPGGIRGKLTSHTSGGSVDGDARRRRYEETHGAQLNPVKCEITLVGRGKTVKTSTTDAGAYEQPLAPGDYTLAFGCREYCDGGTGDVHPNPPPTITIKPGAWLDVSWTCEIYAK